MSNKEVTDQLLHINRILTDGRLDDYEANLLRRISGLIHVPDIETGAARQRAATNLGLN